MFLMLSQLMEDYREFYGIKLKKRKLLEGKINFIHKFMKCFELSETRSL
jgi:hypothetical protein